jgi:hypothetical protein
LVARNENAALNDGGGFEEEVLVALILASHYYASFNGTPFLVWVGHVVSQLSPYAYYEEFKLIGLPDSLKDVMIKILSPPNNGWSPELLASDFINVGDTLWNANGDQRDATLSCSTFNALSARTDSLLICEMKCCESKKFGGIVAVCEKLQQSGCKIGMLITVSLADSQNATLAKIPDAVKVYKCKLDGKALIFEQISPNSTGEIILIVLDLEVIYPDRMKLISHSV